MDHIPSVSIVIPTYNHAHFLQKCLQSVIEQTYSDWEAIIVNNFSEDDTVEVVNSFQDPRIQLINFRNNGIIAASRNQGIKNARGRYIAFLDSDDIWMPDKLDKQVRQMEADSEILLSYVLFTWMLDNGMTRGVWPKQKNRFRGRIFKSLYLKCVIPNSGVMVRREVFSELGLLNESKKLIAAEDSDMWLRIARRGVIDYVDQPPLLMYRVRKESTSRGLLRQWKRHLYVARKFAPHAGVALYLLNVMVSTTNVCKLTLINYNPVSIILKRVRSW